ncbi:hypothetical protein [Zobellia laminariae]|uniref:hypothetical protein n=1 Tax=Zobellia laminariae TaxID=248906 RepID=UPI003EF8F0A1
MMLDYPNLIRLEQEIKDLLDCRLVEYQYKEVHVEAYYAMDGTIMCRIELFASVPEILDRIAKYEAELKEGFYYEAEQILIGQLELVTIKNAS